MAVHKAIVVHGGAGLVSAERFDRLRAGVRAAAEAGNAILGAGGSALDAVVAAVRVLEDDPEFNAGTGAALTRDGTVETDASVMDGDTRRVGAVAAVPDLGNAIALARAVLDAGEHVLLAGPAAWRFAAEVGIAPAAPGALITERARRRLAEVNAEREGGTVGAVARDAQGRFAAATSTGGVVRKRSGRVGDSPIPGAGTWADREIAVSATGDGEAILRLALARTIAAYATTGMTAREASVAALTELRRLTGGSAGVIAIASPGSAGARSTPGGSAESIASPGSAGARSTPGGSAESPGGSAESIDRSETVFVQLSQTMPVAWIDDSGAGDSMGEPI